MVSSLKKRGQKIIRNFSRASIRVSEEGKEHIKENLVERISHIENIRLLIFEWALLVVALIMLAVTQAFWFGDSYAGNYFTTGGTYTEATLGGVNSMNPLFATTNSEKVLSRLMFATISTVDYSGHPGIGLAESILPSENGKIWTIKLRDGLKWSDGEPITNEDVIFTAELIKNPAVNSVYDINLSKVKISENEKGEIVFNLPSAYADFISALNIPVLPKHVLKDADPKTLVENSFSTSPVTSGAFSFNAIQTTPTSEEKTIYLSSNDNYYKGKTMLNSFAVHAYDNKEAIISALNAGSVTGTAELSDADAETITSGQIIQKDSSLNAGAFIFFNTTSEKLNNATLRRAIREGISVENLREVAPETLPLNYPLLESQITLTKYPDIPAYNFEAAKEKIAALVGEEPPVLKIATVNSGYLPVVTNVLASQLEMLGLKVDVSISEEDQEFITNVITKRNYDLLVYEIELGADPDLLPYYHSSQASTSGLNLSNYRNMLVDDLLLGARDTIDMTLRTKKYETFLEYWVNEVPAIALYRPNLTYYYNKNVRTFGNDVRLVTALDRFSDINNWATVKTTKNKTP
ncbi:hypothetical protein IJJ05_02540 [Candidatus Saccharibacteria bacterium]|nr:hypothetical protein [Candidatus Saccharibacteria bacterium]